jgi:hypothetical protein
MRNAAEAMAPETEREAAIDGRLSFLRMDSGLFCRPMESDFGMLIHLHL